MKYTDYLRAFTLEDEEKNTGYHRYRENFSKKQDAYPYYNAVRIPNSPIVLAEGPLDYSLIDFFKSNFFNQAYPVDILVAVGPSLEMIDQVEKKVITKYFDYFDFENTLKLDCDGESLAIQSEFVTASDFFSHILKKDFTKIEESNSLKFHKIKVTLNGDLEKSKEGYVMHIAKWPDHGTYDFFDQDLHIITKFARAMHNKPFFAHCSAGLGRAPTFISICQAITSNIILNTREFLQEYANIINNMREVKPNVMCLESQGEMAIKTIKKCSQLEFGDHKLLPAKRTYLTASNHDVDHQPEGGHSCLTRSQ